LVSPVLLVAKATSERRMCVDYQKLNRQTVPDRNCLPLIRDLLGKQKGSRNFSKLIFKSALNQVHVKTDDMEKKAFRTKFEAYDF
jgi:hypothetical protein